MKPFYRDLRLAIIVALIAFAACWGNNAWLFPSHPAPQRDSHVWLHDKLGITSEQDNKLHPIEERFTNRKKEIEARIREANRALGTAIMEDKRYSDRVKAGVDAIHHAQGELQKATMEHLFEMQTALTPEQKDTLNKLAADALQHNP
jgi:Spy/CpxP family protein refolding chaperone